MGEIACICCVLYVKNHFRRVLLFGRWDFLLAPKVVLRRVNNHLDTFRDANMPLLNNKKAISAEGGAEIYTFQYQ